MTSSVPQRDVAGPVVRRGVAGPFAALLSAVLSFSLMQTMVVPALPDLRSEFGTTTTAISWVLSAFLLTSSVGTVLIGRLGDMFGKRRLLLLSLAVLAAGTLLAALSGTIGTLIAARAVQGLGAATFPLAFGLVREVFPRDRVPVAIGVISAMFGIGFGVGLVVPGPIVDTLGWQWIFWLSLVMILLAIALVWVFVRESPVLSPGRVDWIGAVLLSAGLVALLLAISEGRSLGWGSAPIIGLFAAAAVLLVVFVVAESRIAQPMINIGMLRLRAVATANVAALIIGFGMYGAFTLVPLYVETPSEVGYGFGASVTEAGLFMVPMAVTMLFAGPLAGRLGARAGFRLTLALACVVGAAGFALFALAHDVAGAIYAGAAVLGVGIGFAFSSLANLVVAAVEPRQTGEATGINTIMRTVGGAIGAQIAATVVASDHLPGTSTPAESGYTAAFVMSAIAMGLATLVALAAPRT
ncbi:MFS transporter [Sphaerisporangium sp. NBC_01403]|uniref:MFS transporter n=1 Tax=Sphaerisporangium sp. NBC_01403 TaxID=2903599 RepID=UPI00324F2ECF